jgi:DNA-binding NarL/FixJ family response regulator
VGSLTVFVADDHPMWRSGVRADLAPHFQIVGESDNATDAIRMISETRPDVALCDLRMPGGGLAVVRACAQHTAFVMLTVSEAERDVLDAVAAGAIGYVTKTVSSAELVDAVRRAAAGQPVFPPALAMLVLGEFRRLASAAPQSDGITRREREVLVLVAQGRTYRQIGEELFISAKTVESHVRNILGKLHLTRREELARYAADHDIN